MRGSLWLGLVVAAGIAAGAQAQATAYPGDAAIVRAEAKAKAASFPCEAELKAGASGPACGRYHAAVLDAMTQENKRQAWCNSRITEDTNFKIVNSCFGATTADMRIGEVTGLERKTSPKTWKAFDNDMAKVSG